jgi:hypothetical protein
VTAFAKCSVALEQRVFGLGVQGSRRLVEHQ